jgi:hypothetical protein
MRIFLLALAVSVLQGVLAQPSQNDDMEEWREANMKFLIRSLEDIEMDDEEKE